MGVAVLCTSAKAADALRRKLYVARADARKRGEKSYEILTISFSPHAGDILYLHKKQEAPDGRDTTDEENDD